ncbi:glycerophosphodiester phosphodiesterase family protein [Nocardia sp. NBC_01009]|uniref:glycerophosphodiester phosphodiesterase family protein n=1 Tax=Nocardia sp. NBC_01009 TaxID=2975996 RepID=UPI003869B451|nr:glycerophosphodiester phosphodiesterase family protein [Nocardia sp. NBC_01009]
MSAITSLWEWIPSWILSALNFGQAYPEGDEDDLFDLGDAWKLAAEELRKLEPELKAVTDRTQKVYTGDGAVQAATEFGKLFAGPVSIKETAKAMEELGAYTRNGGTELEYTKCLEAGFAGITAYTVIALIAAWPWGEAGVPLALGAGREALAIAAGEGAERLALEAGKVGLKNLLKPYFKQITLAGLKEGLKTGLKIGTKAGVKMGLAGAGFDFAIQTGQILEDHRDKGYDLGQTLKMGVEWGAGGFLGAPVGVGMSRLLGRTALSPGLRGLLSGMTGGAAGGLGMYAGGVGYQVGNQLAHGYFDWNKIDKTFNPQLLVVGAALGGMHGAKVGLKEGRGPTLGGTGEGLPDGGPRPRGGGDGSSHVPEYGTAKQAKQIYRDMMREIHPDTAGDGPKPKTSSGEEFDREVNNAYERAVKTAGAGKPVDLYELNKLRAEWDAAKGGGVTDAGGGPTATETGARSADSGARTGADRGAGVAPTDRGAGVAPTDGGKSAPPAERGARPSVPDRGGPGRDGTAPQSGEKSAPRAGANNAEGGDRTANLATGQQEQPAPGRSGVEAEGRTGATGQPGAQVEPRVAPEPGRGGAEPGGADVVPQHRGADVAPERRGTDVAPAGRGADVAPEQRSADPQSRGAELDQRPNNPGAERTPAESNQRAGPDTTTPGPAVGEAAQRPGALERQQFPSTGSLAEEFAKAPLETRPPGTGGPLTLRTGEAPKSCAVYGLWYGREVLGLDGILPLSGDGAGIKAVGFSSDQIATAARADWHPGGFRSLDEAATLVRNTGGSVLGLVEFKGVHGPMKVGAHQLTLFRPEGRPDVVMVREFDGHRAYEYEFQWGQDHSNVAGVYGIVYGPDGRPAIPLEGKPAGMAGVDFAYTRAGARPAAEPPRPPSVETQAYAEDAVRQLGGSAKDLMPVDRAGEAVAQAKALADKNAAWWHSLGQARQEAMIEVHPAEVGNAKGLPGEAKNAANRLALERDIYSFRARRPERLGSGQLVNPEFGSGEPKLLRAIIDTRTALHRADQLAQVMHPDVHHPPVLLLSYGNGEVVIAFGDVDRATSVSWHVLDGNSGAGSLPEDVVYPRNHYETTSRQYPDARVASILAYRYDVPGAAAIGPEAAAGLLREQIAGFNVARQHLPDPQLPSNHVFGYGPGAATASAAAENARLAGEISTLTMSDPRGSFRVPDAATYGLERGSVAVVGPAPSPPGASWPSMGLGRGGASRQPRAGTGIRRITVDPAPGSRSSILGRYLSADPDTRIPSPSLATFGKIAAEHGAGQSVSRSPAETGDGTTGPAAPSAPRAHPRHLGPALPVDWPPVTGAELAHVTSAKAKLQAQFGPTAEFPILQRPVPRADPVADSRARTTANARWWHSLSAQEKSAMVRVHPKLVGNTDGVSYGERDVANRLAVTRGLERFLARKPAQLGIMSWFRTVLTDAERTELRNLINTRNHLAAIERGANEMIGSPEVQLVAFDESAYSGNGRVSVSIGNADTASVVTRQIGGYGTTLLSLLYRSAFARGQYELATRLDPGIETATIIDIGYHHPTAPPEAANPIFAEVGGYVVARDIAAYNATRRFQAGLPGFAPYPQLLTAHGHSYGSTTLSHAGVGGRLGRPSGKSDVRGEIDQVILSGSPGAGPLLHARQFGIGAQNVYVLTAHRDPIAKLGADEPGRRGRFFNRGLGADPSNARWGAVRVTAEPPRTPEFRSGMRVHQGYNSFADLETREPTEALLNIGLITVGRGADAVRAEHRPAVGEPTLWQRIASRPVDPERARVLPDRQSFWAPKVVSVRDIEASFAAIENGSPSSFRPDNRHEVRPGVTQQDLDYRRELEHVLAPATPPDAWEIALARSAFDPSGPVRDVQELLHPEYADDEVVAKTLERTQINHRWWHSLGPRQQAAVRRVFPNQLGNADGIPFTERDPANRLGIARDLAGFRAGYTAGTDLGEWLKQLSARERLQLENLVYTHRALLRAERKARSMTPFVPAPPVQVMSFDATEFGGEGRAVVAFGNADSADIDLWQIPGITTTLQRLSGRLTNSWNLYEVAARLAPEANLLSIAWLGYDAPSGGSMMTETVSPKPAVEGGRLLVRDLWGFHTTRVLQAQSADGAPVPFHRLFAHSFGSTTTAYAAAGDRFADIGAFIDVILLGSPGMGPLRHADEFRVANVYDAAGSADPVTWLGANTPGQLGRFAGRGQGMDPSTWRFGAIRIAAEFPDLPRFSDGLRTHRQYWQFLDEALRMPTEPLGNFALIAVGRGDAVLQVAHRPGVDKPTWLQRRVAGRPNDPEASRPAPVVGAFDYRLPPLPSAATSGLPSGPEVQGHRGGRGLWAENTLPGFRQAMAMGVDAIELDVGLTADGTPVIHHEQRIDSKTVHDTAPAAPGDPQFPYVGKPIRELTLEQVRTLDTGVVNSAFASTQQAEPGSRVPTLDEVAQLVLASGWNGTLCIEVKTDPKWRTAEVEALVRATVETMDRHGVRYRLLGFDWRVLTAAQELAPSVDRVALVAPRTVTNAWLGRDPGVPRLSRLGSLAAQAAGRARSLGGDLARAAFEAGATMLSPERTMVTEALMRQAGAVGLPVVPWTVNSPVEMGRLIELGVAGIVTDFPDRMRAALTDRGLAVPGAAGSQPRAGPQPSPVEPSAATWPIAATSAAGRAAAEGLDSATGRADAALDEALRAIEASLAEFGVAPTALAEPGRPLLHDNLCAPWALELIRAWLRAISGRTDVLDLPVLDIGPGGMLPDALENHAGGRLEAVGTRDDIAERLLGMGHGAAVLVVDRYRGPVDEHGVGAHAYVMINDRDTVRVYDRNTAGPQQYRWGQSAPEVLGSSGIFYTAAGDPVRPTDVYGPDPAVHRGVGIGQTPEDPSEPQRRDDAAVEPVTPSGDSLQDLADYAVEFAAKLRALGVEPMLVGGLVLNDYRATPRPTGDLDFLVRSLNDVHLRLRAEGYEIEPKLERRGAEPYLVYVRGKGFPVDLIVAETPFQHEALNRAVNGRITVEDALVFKLIWWRSKDRADVESILRAGHDLDLAYIERWAAEWEVGDLWAQVWQSWGTAAPVSDASTPVAVPTETGHAAVAPGNVRSEPGAAIPEYSAPEPDSVSAGSDTALADEDESASGTAATMAGTAVPEPDSVAPTGPPVRRQLLRGGPGSPDNEVYSVEFADGSVWVYKPVAGQTAGQIPVPPSDFIVREVGFRDLDRMLEFDIVPDTVAWNGFRGPGSLQRVLPFDPQRPIEEYSWLARSMMAIEDYVGGSRDRNHGGYVTTEQAAGRGEVTAGQGEATTERGEVDAGALGPERMGAIDNEHTFPIDASGKVGIRSSFVFDALNQPLHPLALERANALPAEQLAAQLRRRGMELATRLGTPVIEPEAIDGAVRRLREIQTNGMITGAHWPGRIDDATRRKGQQSVSVPAPSDIAEGTAAPRPEVQGHRGGRGLWSENTLPGFRKAMELGVDAIELDVGATKDGIPVIHHEQHIDAATVHDTAPITPGDPLYPYVGRAIRELTYQQIRTLDTGVVHENYAETQSAVPGSHIPSLAEVARLVAGHGVTLSVEIKTDPSWRDEDVRALVAASVRVLDEHQVPYRILGFDWRVLTHAADLAPRAARVALVSPRTATESWTGQRPGVSSWSRLRGLAAQRMGAAHTLGGDIAAAAVAAGATMLSPERTMVTPELMRQAQGLSVVPYTVNEPAEMRRQLDLGVAGIVTDFPDRLRAVLTERGLAVPDAVVNDCAPAAVRTVIMLTGSTAARVLQGRVGPSGWSAGVLESHAGGRLRRARSHAEIIDQLRDRGEGATVLVVDEYHGPVDRYGVGAHAYVLTIKNGDVVAHDERNGAPRPYPEGVAVGEIKGTWGIYYDAAGNPLHPNATHAPDVRPESNIGQTNGHTDDPTPEPRDRTVAAPGPGGPAPPGQTAPDGAVAPATVEVAAPDSLRALAEYADAFAAKLRALGVEPMLVGGLVLNDYRSTPRSLRDVDFLVRALNDVHLRLREEGYEIAPKAERPGADPYLVFVRGKGFPVDLIVAETPFQHEALNRAVNGRISVEDALVFKLIWWRPKDRADVQSILAAGHDLDLAYIEHWATEWEVEDLWSEVWQTWGAPAQVPVRAAPEPASAVGPSQTAVQASPEPEPIPDVAQTTRDRGVDVARNLSPEPISEVPEIPVSPQAGAAGWTMSAPEQELLGHGAVVREEVLDTGHFHLNEILIVHFADGAQAVYRPGEREPIPGMELPEAGPVASEVGTYRLDQMLEFHQVPPTVAWTGSRGPGSLQFFVPGLGEARAPQAYSRIERFKTAIRDYIAGECDRQATDGTVKDLAITADNDFSFPEQPTSFVVADEDLILSDDPDARVDLPFLGTRFTFVVEALDKPVPPELLAQVRAVAPADVAAMLRELGHRPTAVAGALRRLAEIQTNGMITGTAWPYAGEPPSGSASVPGGTADTPAVGEVVPEQAAAGPGPGVETMTGRETAETAGDSASTPAADRCTDGEPVDMASGDVLLDRVDARIAGVFPFELRRTHVSSRRLGRHFGPGWLSALDERLEIDDHGIVLVCADGAVLSYPFAMPGGVEVLPASGPRWPLSLGDDGYRIADPSNGVTREFGLAIGGQAAGPTIVPISAYRHRTGHSVLFEADERGIVHTVRHSGGTRLRMVADQHATRVTALSIESGSTSIPLARYRYSDDGDLLAVVDHAGHACRYTYDNAHRLASWTDRNGISYHHRYDAAGRCVAQIGTGGVYANSYVYGTDAATGGGWAALIETVRPLDVSTSARSMSDARVQAELDALQAMPVATALRTAGPAALDPLAVPDDPTFGRVRLSVFRTDVRGDVWQIIDGAGAVSIFERDAAHHLVRQVDPTGATVIYQRNRYGLITAVTGPDGATTTVRRGAWGEPVGETGPGGRTWTHRADAAGNTIATLGPDGALTRYDYEYRPTGAVLRRITDPTGLITEIGCDASGLPIRVTAPGNKVWQYERDAFARITAVTDPLGRRTTHTWTVDGKPLEQRNPDGTVLSWTYDREGNQVSGTDEAGHISTTAYTVLDSPLRVTTTDGARLRIGYDTQLQIISVTNPAGLVWRYEYDTAGRMIAETDYNGARTTYQRDRAGRVCAATNAVGQTTAYVFDAAGRLAEERTEDGLAVYRYDRHGDLVEAANSDAVVRISRDATGRVVAEQINDVVVGTAYDAAGKRIARTVETPVAGRAWRTVFDYDDTGLLVSAATADGSGPARVMGFGYDPAGNETIRGIGAARMTRRYDERDRIVAQHASNPNGIVAGRDWSYRADGYAIGVEDVLRGPRRFEVNPVGRVTAVTALSGVDATPTVAERYSYDQAGVLTLARDTAPIDRDDPVVAGDVSSTGTLVRTAGRRRFRYDAAGRLVRSYRPRISRLPEIFEFTHTPAGQIRTVSAPDGSIWRYAYDPFGRRVAKTHTERTGSVLASVVFGWDGDDLVYQHHSSRAAAGTSWCLTYRPDTGEPLTQHRHSDADDLDAEFYAIVTDLAGAPTELLDPDTGAVAGWSTSTLWGRTHWNGSAATDLRFAGQFHDAETGLHYNRHRYYHPVTATYTAPDPLGLEPNPVSATAYVHNPHTWVDPLGLAACGGGWWRRIRTLGGIGAARQAYVDATRAITVDGLARVEAGEDPETVARWAIDQRNEMKLATRAKLPRIFNIWAERRNMGHYNDPVGPTYEFLHDVRGKTPVDIIKGAGRTSRRVNRLLGVR